MRSSRLLVLSLSALSISLFTLAMNSTAVPAAFAAETTSGANPLLADWNTRFQVPPFAQIKEADFLPAIKDGMARQQAEIAQINCLTEPPSFANTIEALERSGAALDRANAVFSVLHGAETNDKLQELAKVLAPLQSAHRDSIWLDETLFRRVKAVWDQRAALALNAEQADAARAHLQTLCPRRRAARRPPRKRACASSTPSWPRSA